MRGLLTFPTATVYVRATTGVTSDELSRVMEGFIVVDAVVENERDVLVLLVGAEEYVSTILSNILCVVGGTRAATHQKFHRSLGKMDIKNLKIPSSTAGQNKKSSSNFAVRKQEPLR